MINSAECLLNMFLLENQLRLLIDKMTDGNQPEAKKREDIGFPVPDEHKCQCCFMSEGFINVSRGCLLGSGSGSVGTVAPHHQNP